MVAIQTSETTPSSHRLHRPRIADRIPAARPLSVRLADCRTISFVDSALHDAARPDASAIVNSFLVLLPPLDVFSYGFDDRSGLSVSRSTGTETCSCAISQSPLIFRYTSVTRTVRSIGWFLVLVPWTC
jgi:hypothetical protein